MAGLRLARVTKRFGRTVALDDVSFDVADGEFFCLLGRSGAGKTTTLRTVAGLEKPTEGDVYLDGVRVTEVHPSRRDVAMIFENLALYPNKTGFENIAFPLRVQRRPEDEVRRRVLEVARVLQIEHILDRYPRTFSGGERQRVAIGRTIVRQPRLYLFDEPLSNLDALLRLNMRAELKHLQRDLGQTIVYVTPDQVEAMSMADRIAVLREGRVQQIGSPLDIYLRPSNMFVAGFIGSPPMNLLRANLTSSNGTVRAHLGAGGLELAAGRFPRLGEARGEIVVGVRPEDIAVTTQGDGLRGRVVAFEPLGGKAVLDVELDRQLVRVTVPARTTYAPDEPVGLAFDPQRVHLFDAASERSLG